MHGAGPVSTAQRDLRMAKKKYPNALPVGSALMEYRITEVLGQGGFGITYLAQDGNLGTDVAIKEYFPESFAQRAGKTKLAAKPDTEASFDWGLDRFLKEARTLAQFEHPNIVPVLRFFDANGTAYMVMAYQQGDSLAQILDREFTLDEMALEAILYPLLDGLEQVHKAGILHRDIKAENIFLRDDGAPVLLDFGAARQAMGERTKDVTRIITPSYAPFEQYHNDGTLGPWTDIYALAAVMYEGLSGSLPTEAPARVLDDTMTTAVEVGAGDYRKAFLKAVDWGLAVQPEDRPQTIADWRAVMPAPLSADAKKRSASPRKKPAAKLPSAVAESPTRAERRSDTPEREPVLTVFEGSRMAPDDDRKKRRRSPLRILLPIFTVVVGATLPALLAVYLIAPGFFAWIDETKPLADKQAAEQSEGRESARAKAVAPFFNRIRAGAVLSIVWIRTKQAESWQFRPNGSVVRKIAGAPGEVSTGAWQIDRTALCIAWGPVPKPPGTCYDIRPAEERGVVGRTANVVQWQGWFVQNPRQ